MDNHRTYFLARAEEEEAKAAAASTDAAADAHLRLARTYRDCADNRGPRPLPDQPIRRRLTIL